MSINEIKEWTLIVSTSISMVSIAVGVLLALLQYRLKLKEEERLAISSRADVDVRLTKSFIELMDLAMGRRQYVLSERAVEELFKRGIVSESDYDGDFDNVQQAIRKLSEYAVVILPAGKSIQEAAIVAIATLATEYEVLREASVQGLESIGSGNPKLAQLTRRYCERLKASQGAMAWNTLEGKKLVEASVAPNTSPQADG